MAEVGIPATLAVRHNRHRTVTADRHMAARPVGKRGLGRVVPGLDNETLRRHEFLQDRRSAFAGNPIRPSQDPDEFDDNLAVGTARTLGREQFQQRESGLRLPLVVAHHRPAVPHPLSTAHHIM